MKLSRFADGLNQDLEAVLNAVVSDLSNGFVEALQQVPAEAWHGVPAQASDT